MFSLLTVVKSRFFKRTRETPFVVCAGALVASFVALTAPTIAAQDFEIRHDSINASGWFGGDDRSCCSPRHVGTAQSVLVDRDATVTSFAFHFSGNFDFAGSPEGHGHAVQLVLNVKDETGADLERHEVAVPDTFAGGYVTWEGLNVSVPASTTLIFSSYMVGALEDSTQYNTGYSGDASAGYADGVGYSKQGTSDADMEIWTDWSQHSWDRVFVLRGTTRATGTGVADSDDQVSDDPNATRLDANFPNPFGATTTIPFSLAQAGSVTITIFDALGRVVAVPVDATTPAGRHTIDVDLTSEPNGLYFYRMQTGGTTATGSMLRYGGLE
jgi:hypothetical protein